jgi:endonuclease G
MVPTRLFKAVYDPHRQQAGVYLVDNAAGAQPQMISLAELAQVSGIDAFPSVSDEVKAEAMPLPSPKSYKERKRRGGH